MPTNNDEAVLTTVVQREHNLDHTAFAYYLPRRVLDLCDKGHAYIEARDLIIDHKDRLWVQPVTIKPDQLLPAYHQWTNAKVRIEYQSRKVEAILVERHIKDIPVGIPDPAALPISRALVVDHIYNDGTTAVV